MLKEEELSDNGLSCHSCGLNLSSKRSLMEHRKEHHSEIIKKCRYFLQGNCAFEASVCWYSHGERLEETQNEACGIGGSFKCSFCENIFENKNQLMVHRKTVHLQANMFQCRDFKQGVCRFNANQCWYKHDDKPADGKDEEEKDSQSSVFQKAPDSPDPPEFIERMMGMMEKLMEKVALLEKSMESSQ